MSILNTTIFSFSIDMEISKQEKNQNIKLYFFSQGKNFTPTPVTLETIIEDILNPFLSVFHGLSGDEVS